MLYPRNNYSKQNSFMSSIKDPQQDTVPTTYC